MKKQNIHRYIIPVVFVTACYYLIKWINSKVTVHPYFGLPEHLLETASWVFAVEHHIIQMLLALALIWVVSRGNIRHWGFSLKNQGESLFILKKFCYYYLVYFIGISFVLQWINYPGPPFSHSFTLSQVIGYLGFGFLLTGLSEEILFRGFIHTFLFRYIPEILEWKNIEMPVAGIIAAVIFTVAHIGFSVFPFELFHLKPLQLLQAFVLGLFYSWAYHKTKSLLAPILAHNISNGSLWVMDYILYYFKG